MLTRREVFVMHLQIAFELLPVVALAIIPVAVMAGGLLQLMKL